MRSIFGLVIKKDRNIDHLLQGVVSTLLRNDISPCIKDSNMKRIQMENRKSILFTDEGVYENIEMERLSEVFTKSRLLIQCNYNDWDHIHPISYRITDDTARDLTIVYGNLFGSDISSINGRSMRNPEGDYIVARKKKDSLLLAKDSIGIKQLYYGENDNFICFCTRKSPLDKLALKINRLLPGQELQLSRSGIVRRGLRRFFKPDIRIFDREKAMEVYSRSIVGSVEKRILDVDRVGIIFSGGVDSSLIANIANRLGKDVVCYCAGLPDSADVKATKESIEELGMEIRIGRLNLSGIKVTLPTIMGIIENWNQLQVETAVPFFYAMRMAANDGTRVVLTGQGADELFLGHYWYPRVLKKEGEVRLIEHMWQDLLLAYREKFERDNKMAEYFDLDLRAPYFDRDVIRTAMSISIDLKTQKDDVMGKFVHRLVGESLDLPLRIAWREKEAAPYGSGIHSAMDQIALESGFKESRIHIKKTKEEPIGSLYRYGNRYLPSDERFGDDHVQAYLKYVALQNGLI